MGRRRGTVETPTSRFQDDLRLWRPFILKWEKKQENNLTTWAQQHRRDDARRAYIEGLDPNHNIPVNEQVAQEAEEEVAARRDDGDEEEGEDGDQRQPADARRLPDGRRGR